MENKTSSSGIGFCGVLQIVFIVLKLLNLVNWSWFKVFLPTIIPFLVFLAVLFIFIVLKIIIHIKGGF